MTFSLLWEFQLVWRMMTCSNRLTWHNNLVHLSKLTSHLDVSFQPIWSHFCVYLWKLCTAEWMKTSIFHIFTVVRNLHWPMAITRLSRSGQIVYVCLSQVQRCKVLIMMDMPGIITVLLCLAMCVTAEDWWIVDEMKNIFAVLQFCQVVGIHYFCKLIRISMLSVFCS